ncbi:LysR family transcriptional regulator [Sciscionella sediminilitoris]|uniref:LysR family transcriptional regulator n=1 Tax=Sciscionella sediminilitoris TaxID=1445613 RepID=UPI00068F1669|nr:LysR family transcriptional regulator [Sciscionella sp. SE31]
MFDLHRLRLLRELSHRGTLASVAAALSYSPSTVSQQLSILESEVGVPLLEQVGRRVRLTAQARILVEHTGAVLDRLETAAAEIARSLEDLTGTLRVAIFQTAALTLLPAALSALRTAHPELRVEVTQAEPEVALPGLLAHDVDLVLAEEYPGHPQPRGAEVERVELRRDPILLARAPGAKRVRSLSRLAGLSWVMEPRGTASRSWATALCRDAGFEPDVPFETDDLLVQAQLVARGHAVALLPELFTANAAPELAMHPIPGGGHARTLFTATRPGMGEHPAVRAFRAALAENQPRARHTPGGQTG